MSIEILMPALSPTMEEGKLAKWLVKEGDEVHSGDILAEIETDKATMEFEAVDEGRIGKILVAEGTEGVKVNQPIATLLVEGEQPKGPVDISAAMQSIKSAVTSEVPKPAKKKAEPVKAAPTPAKPAAAGARVFASPLAKRIAQQKGIDIAAVTGSGPRGRIVKADIESAKPGAVKPAAAAPMARAAEATGGGMGVAPLADAKLF